MQAVSEQRIGKHASTTTKLFLEMVFSIRFLKIGCKEDKWGPVSRGLAAQVSSAREAENSWRYISSGELCKGG
jgi:hypothetical protein